MVQIDRAECVHRCLDVAVHGRLLRDVALDGDRLGRERCDEFLDRRAVEVDGDDVGPLGGEPLRCPRPSPPAAR